MADLDVSHFVTGCATATAAGIGVWALFRSKKIAIDEKQGELDAKQADLDKQIAITKDERETNLIAKWERVLRDVEQRCEKRDEEQRVTISEQKQIIDKLNSTVETLRNLTAELRVQNTAQEGRIRLLEHVAGVKAVQAPKQPEAKPTESEDCHEAGEKPAK
jgi:hypothetical protein